VSFIYDYPESDDWNINLRYISLASVYNIISLCISSIYFLMLYYGAKPFTIYVYKKYILYILYLSY